MARNLNLSDELARAVIRHTLEVQRFEGELRKRALTQLIKLDSILVGLIAQGVDTYRLSTLLKMAREEIEDAVDAAGFEAIKDNERLIQLEAKVAAEQINALFGPIAVQPSSQAFIDRVTKRALVQGAPAKEWWSRQSNRTYQRFADIVRQGILLGESSGEITSKWRLASTQLKRHAETQVRTSVLSVTNAARQELYEANSDVVKGLQAVATLDLRTSTLCRGRDGMVWYLDGKPIDADTEYPGPPPWHWNCRTTMVPVLKHLDEISEGKARLVGPQARASMNGQVPATMTYDQFFKTLSSEQQREVLGNRKYELWKKNKLSMRDMMDQSGRELTIEQLEARYG